MAAIAAAGCGGGSAPGSSSLVTDSAGIRIVENRAPDRAGSWTPVHIADLMTPDSALTAVPWGVAADPATGRIYVVDRAGTRVAVFDRSGEYIETYGRRGGGPGEFQGASALSVGSEGELTVWDAGRGILSRWSAGGALVDERQAPVDYWGPGFHAGGDGIVTVTSRTSEREMRQMLVRLTEAGDSAVLHTVPRELVMAELPCMARPMPRIFAPDIVWTARGDTVRVLNGPDYRIDIYVDGTLSVSVRRSLEPLAVTEGMAAEWARLRYGRFLSERCGGMAPEALVAEIGHEERASPIQRLAVDPAGRLWVTRSSNGLTPDRVDVLDADGRYAGTLDATGMPLAFLSPSRFVSFAIRPATGETILSVYELADANGRTRDSAADSSEAGVGSAAAEGAATTAARSASSPGTSAPRPVRPSYRPASAYASSRR